MRGRVHSDDKPVAITRRANPFRVVSVTITRLTQPPNIIRGMREARDRSARRVEVFMDETARAERDVDYWDRKAHEYPDGETKDAHRRANERWALLRSALASAKADLADWNQRIDRAERRDRKRRR